MRRFLSFAVLLAAAPSVVGQTFATGDFSGWSWSSLSTGAASSSVTFPNGGGNPGAHVSVANMLVAVSDVETVLHDPAAVWDPAVDGPICRLSMSLEFHSTPDGFGQGQAVRCVTRQNGAIYAGGYILTGVSGSWTGLALTDLGASAFHRIDVDDGTEPDFGPTGALLAFGFSTRNTTVGGGYTLTNLYDNWSIEVVPGAPAAATPVGAGCGLAQPVLAAGLPVLGGGLSLGLSATTPNAVGVLVAGLPTVAPVPLGIGCELHLIPQSLVLLTPLATDGAGAWATSAPIPDDGALCGLQVTLQALLKSASAIQMDVSNGVLLTLGG